MSGIEYGLMYVFLRHRLTWIVVRFAFANSMWLVQIPIALIAIMIGLAVNASM